MTQSQDLPQMKISQEKQMLTVITQLLTAVKQADGFSKFAHYSADLLTQQSKK
jgi:hypothetical protein